MYILTCCVCIVLIQIMHQELNHIRCTLMHVIEGMHFQDLTYFTFAQTTF